VKQSWGWIDVDSAPDRGTTFTIYFPQTTEPKPPPQPKPVAPKHSAAVVLVVEDEKSVQDLVRMTLERRGYTVLVSASGEEALEVMRSHAGAIDLLLVDVVLPGMTGDVLASRVRAAQPAMKTLFMTGYVDDQVLKKGQIAPGDILLKPFTASALLERVATVLHHSWFLILDSWFLILDSWLGPAGSRPIPTRRLEPSCYCVVDQNSRRFDVPVGMPLNRLVVAALRMALRTVDGDADGLPCR